MNNAESNLRDCTRQSPIVPQRVNVVRVAAVFVILILTSCFATAQNYLTNTGEPTYAAAEPVDLGFTNAANGDLHLSFPFGSYPQRGSKEPFTIKETYDSSAVWTIQCVQTCQWTPSANAPGWQNVSPSTGLSLQNFFCGSYGTICGVILLDPSGTQRYFFPSTSVGTSLQHVYASDSSGYMAVLNGTGGLTGWYVNYVYAPDGTIVYGAAGPDGTGIREDSNGNYTTMFKDTLGRAMPPPCTLGLTVTTCTYPLPNSQYGTTGGTSTYTVKGINIPVKTGFGQSGVSEYNGTIMVVQSITLPDNTSYSFTYDCDSTSGNVACGSPGGQGAYYGLVTNVTLPTGGAVRYGYVYFTDSYSNKSQWLGSIQGTKRLFIAPSVLSKCSSSQVGCQQKVTVSDDAGNATIYTFTLNNGAWPVTVQRQDSNSNILSTITNTYDFSQPCQYSGCHGASLVRLLTTQTTVPMSSYSLTKQTVLQYDSPQTGNVTARKEWGYYPGTLPSTPDRATYMTYLATGTNNINRPLSVTLCSGSGSESACPGGGSRVSQTLYAYDNYSSCASGLVSVAGAANHDDTYFGNSYTTRGNPTKIQQWVSASTYLTETLCYDTTGQVVQEFDPKGNSTTYSYQDNFYSDNGSNSLAAYTPSTFTNAYVKAVTNYVGTTTMGYYYGSGLAAYSQDPNGVKAYAHFVDPYDRTTEQDAELTGWDKAVYTTPTQSDLYSAVGDAVPSSGCSSCRHKQLILDSLGRKISEKLLDSNGVVKSEVDTSYDSAGRVFTVSHPYAPGTSSVAETYQYDGLDRPLSVTHPDGQTVSTYYGALVTGLPGGLGSQQGAASTYGYGYPTLMVDEAGKQKQQWQDAFGRVIEVDEPTTVSAPGEGSVGISGSEQSGTDPTCTPDPPAQCPVYWDKGTVSVTVNGFTMSASYGKTSTSSSIASALVTVINSTNTSPVTAVLNGSTVGLISKATGAGSNYSLSTSVTYNSLIFPSASFTASPSGATLLGGTASGSSLASPLVTLYSYDAADHITQVVQGQQTRTYTYDGLGRATSVTTPEAGTETMAYSVSGALCSGDSGNVCQKTDARGVVTTYLYDPIRLVGKTYTIPPGSNVAAMSNVCTTSTGVSANVCYFYDQGGAAAYAIGRRTQMQDPSGSETTSYDAAGRIRQVTKVIASSSYTTQYQYNAGDEVTQITYPSGRVLQKSYNNVGWLCEIAPASNGCGTSTSPFATAYSYDAEGRVAGFSYGNGVAATYAYSPKRSQLETIKYSKGAANLFSLRYWYQIDSTNCPSGNSVGNNSQIQCISDGVEGGRTANYAYDALGRITAASTNGSTTFPGWGLSWGYDRYGNRLSQALTTGSGYTNYLTFNIPGGGQRNQPDGWCFDASGNLLAKSGSCPPVTANFVYDGENRMVGDPLVSEVYLYDGNGIRVQKCMPTCASPTSSTVFVFSGGSVIAEYDKGAPVAAPSREFIYSPGLPGTGLLASFSSGAITYFHSDHLSWRVSTDVNGNVSGSQGSFPFGESWYSSKGNEFVFTSYQRDSESGLDYAMARYYDSSVGRFCSADPVGGEASDPQTWNRYVYGRNDPIDKTDPSGKSWWSSLLIDIGVAVVAYFAPELLPALKGGEAAAAPIESVDATVAGVTSNATTLTVAATGPSIGTALVGGVMAAGLQPPKTPCYPHVKKFVDNNRAAAQDIAKQIGNGATAQEVLATSAAETTYGSPQSLAAHGNFFGLHGGGFLGQIDSYTTKPATGPGVVTPVFPSADGFALSGQVFAKRESPFFSNGNASDPANFFQTIHAHGYGTGNSSYMNKVMDHKDPKSGKLIHGSYSLVGACL